MCNYEYNLNISHRVNKNIIGRLGCCMMIINYGQLMPFANSAFRTEERREINGLINELRVVMKFKKVLDIWSVFIF